MASPTELAREAQQQCEMLGQELTLLKQEIEKSELYKLRERLAVLESQVAELKKAKEEAEKRQWQFVFIALGATFALFASLVVQLLLFWMKR